MECATVETGLGAVLLWGRFSDFRADRPLVLAISGAFPRRDELHFLDDRRADYTFVHLPGFYSPPLVTTSIGAFVAALREAMRLTFPRRSFVALGVSTGALVAMGMGEASRIVAVEPFLSTRGLWSLQEWLRNTDLPPAHRAWAEAIFNDRDYSALLDALQIPCQVVVGDVPLEPMRPIRGHPSLVSVPDRVAFAAHPLVTLSAVPGGHDLSREHIRAALDRALRADEQHEAEAMPGGHLGDAGLPAATARA